ncbi:MAG: SxtJ family membrane protein [Planctomycetota bacterium]
MSTAEQDTAAAEATSPYVPGSGLPGTPNTVTGAAQHKDLYRVPKDPKAKRKADAGQARVLGLGFMVFFSGILGGISLWLNGALYPHATGWNGLEQPVESALYPEQDADGEAIVEDQPARLGPASSFLLEWSDGERTAVEVVQQEPAEGQEAREPKEGETWVHVAVNAHWAGSLVAPTRQGATPKAVVLASTIQRDLPGEVADAGQVRPGTRYAWEEAKLLRLVPTRYVIFFGLGMGLLGLLVPVVLVPFYIVWMKYVTAPLGFVNTRLILGVVFFLVLTPMALLVKIFGKDRLRRVALPKGESYWVPREQQRDHKHFEKGF